MMKLLPLRREVNFNSAVNGMVRHNKVGSALVEVINIWFCFGFPPFSLRASAFSSLVSRMILRLYLLFPFSDSYDGFYVVAFTCSLERASLVLSD